MQSKSERPIVNLMKKLLLALLTAFFASRCALVAHGRYQTVHVQSTPAGAAMRVDCGDAPTNGGLTPGDVTVRRGAEHCRIVLSAPGYRDQTVTFTRVISRAVWANLGPGLLIGTLAGAAAAVPFGDENSGNNAAIGGIVIGAGGGYFIDRTTGAACRQVPATVNVQLEKREP
ncbi:MAG: hypothetical protein QOI24_4605 [Acidobacteriota bacterium]|nr:hypothetical protein [Acidobacteriota bacterium]